MGRAAAIILSACTGAFVLGLATLLAQSSKSIKGLLNWRPDVGSLTGTVGVAIVVWLVCWAILHRLWKERDVPFGRIWALSLILLLLGFVMVFPPVWELF